MKFFIDCEFDGFKGELISLAVVCENGSSIYLVNKDIFETSLWVSENVMPILYKCPVFAWKVGLDEFGMLIYTFIEEQLEAEEYSHPVIISDWPADIRYFCEVIEYEGGRMIPLQTATFAFARINSYPNNIKGAIQHNAWWDAYCLKEKYINGV